MRKISIAEALRSVKLMESKMLKVTTNLVPVVAINKNDTLIIGRSITDFEETAKAQDQKLTQLFINFTQLKEVIATSNATTKVMIGDVPYTVSAAIERKNSIKHEQFYLNHLQRQLLQVNQQLQKNEASLSREAEEKAASYFAKDGVKSDSKEYRDFVEGYKDRNALKLIDPLNLREKVEKLDYSISTFLAEVDWKLNESNVNTTVELNDDVVA